MMKLEAVISTPEEEAILQNEYKKYKDAFHLWNFRYEEVLSFDDWWRTMADNEKDKREGK